MTQLKQSTDKDSLAAFAGLVILIVALAILFGVTSPTGANIAPTDTATSEAELTQEASVVQAVQVEETAVVETTDATQAEATAEAAQSESNTTTSVSNANLSFDPEAAARGQILFATCAGCHGPDAKGLPGLGKNLVESEFARGLTDAELVAFVTTGRPIWDAANTTGVDMPPKGGNPAFSESDLHDIVAYIRSLESAYDSSADSSSADNSTDTTTTGNAFAYDPELAAKGQILFATCAGCHGPDAKGLPGLGKNLVESEFARGLTDAELVAFVTTGRPIWDAANTTGVDMPPKGGNPAFSEDDLYAIVAYIRSLQNQ